MSSFMKPNPLTYKADGAITKGMAVKAGSDAKHVAKATAVSDKIIGIALNTTTDAEDTIEVAHNGGGAPGLLGGSVSFGDFLTVDGNGKLVASSTSNDHIVAQAMDGGALNEVIGVNVCIGNY